MRERLNYGEERQEEDHDDYQEHHASRYGDPDYDPEGEDAEDLQEPVEHQADHTADDSVQSDSAFDAQFGWRSKARRRRGRFVPPDIRGYAAPAFVRVTDLQARATSGSEAERDPEA